MQQTDRKYFLLFLSSTTKPLKFKIQLRLLQIFHLGSYTIRTDIKGRKGYLKKSHAADRTIGQLQAVERTL